MTQAGSFRLALAMVVAAPLAACKSASMTPDAGAGADRGPAIGEPNDLLSDFAQDRAVVVPLGDPARNGIWYSYNDGTCRQTPAHGEAYYPSTPAVLPPGFSGGRALHASWSQCTVWGAGVGADFAVPVGADSAAVGPRTPYSLQPYSGVAFWAMAAPGTSTQVRVKLVMRISTQIQDRGACDEGVLGPDSCGDEWGEPVELPADGSWAQVTVRFSDPTFRQEGWGNPFAWNPADVFGIQFQTVAVSDVAGLYDFWIDDLYLVR